MNVYRSLLRVGLGMVFRLGKAFDDNPGISPLTHRIADLFDNVQFTSSPLHYKVAYYYKATKV